MKIVDIRTIVVGNPWKNWVLLELQTDEGISGLGEATGGLSSRPHEAHLAELRPVVIGQDPLNVRGLWDRMFKSMYLQNTAAMAGIEMACWDICGKALGAPVWQLLGGLVRPRVRAYANGWYTGPRSPQGLAEAARRVVGLGYTALKFDPFGSAYRDLSGHELSEALNLIAAVREAVGETVDIMIEAHDRFSVQTAIRVGREIERFHPVWLEAPVLSEDIRAMNEVARAIAVPVAGGERFKSARECAELLHERVIDIVQPELLGCGGVQGLMEVASVAAAYGASIAPHNAQSPFTTVVNAHVGLGRENLLIQEVFDDFLVPWSREVMSGTAVIKDGYIEVPSGPGYGVEFHFEEMQRHPYSELNFMRLFESGWEKRVGNA